MPRFPERLFWPVLAAATVALTACSGETPSLSEAVETEVSASAVTIPDGVERFLLAQGTMCTETGGKYGDCTNLYGPGWPADIIGWCSFDQPTDVCAFTDLGVWDRWLREKGEPGFGTTWDGTVTERTLADGRRRVHLRMHGTNVMNLVTAIDAAGDDPYAVADLYMGTSAAEALAGVRTPTLGRANVEFEFILPATYVGYPDILEFFAREWPAGFEFLSFRYNVNLEGEVRREFEGIAAGEQARLNVYSPFNYELAGKLPEHAVATMHRYTFFSPGYHFELKPVGR